MLGDDASTYASTQNIVNLTESVERDLAIGQISDWFWANKLSLNICKTNFMMFTKPEHHEIKLYVDGQEIQQIPSTIFLRITVDKDLNWKEHIQVCKSKLACSLYVINASKSLLDRTCFCFTMP